MVKAIIWDMDGVLIESEDMHPVVESETAKFFGMDFSPEKVSELYLGVDLITEFNDMIKKSGRTDISYDQMRRKRDELLEDYLKNGIKSVPYSKDVVSELSSKYKIGLVSSGERFWAEDALKRLGLFEYFEVIIFAEDVENHKPHPEPFLKAAKILNLNPDEIIVVEDSTAGLKGAKDAGMKVIIRIAEHNKTKDFSSGDYRVKDLKEIPKIIDSINEGGDPDSPSLLDSRVRKNHKKRVGIIGGGQLGRMMTDASLKLNLDITVLEPTENPPAVQVGAKQIIGSLNNPEKIRELAEMSDFLTWEIEHINTEVLEELENEGFKINPSPKTLAKIKDKLLQKEFLKQNGIPTAPFKKVESIEDIVNASKELGLPLLLKTRFGGYDGRGNFVVRNEEDIKAGFEKLGGENLYVEGFVDFGKELAVMAARDKSGNIKIYPVVETIHENNILQVTLAPAPIAQDLNKRAEEFAKKVMEHLEGAGVFGIEMFLTKNGEILVNEIAPRVHNSGHYTIEACITSQFENQLRAVSEMELGETDMKVGAAVMINILGDRSGVAEVAGIEEAGKLGNVFVHIYGKKDVKPERKMGHLTIVGDNLEEVLEKANKARSLIRI